MSKANSTLQDRTLPQQPSFQPDPQAPNTKIIECSCSNAERRSDDNSEWVNILKEPILVKKGSEIRVQQSAIDMTGIDGDIIQFQSEGTTQDNSHTLLCQHYTVNDGTNGKTCTYDYMGANSNQLTVMESFDPGEGYTQTSPFTPFIPLVQETISGTGTGFSSMFCLIKAHAIRPKYVSINTAGKGYTNGAKFKIATSVSTDSFEGYIQTDDEGRVVKVVFTKNTADNAPIDPNDIVFDLPQTGTRFTTNNFFTFNGLEFTGFHDSSTSMTRGSGYTFGDRISVNTDANAVAISEEFRAIFGIKSVIMGTGQPSIQAFMDPGYNYEKVPVFRWSHTYDLNTNFSYGSNLGSRTFESEGNTIGVSSTSAHQVNDPCLSAGPLIMNKEDDFVPGIFHNTKSDDNFIINSPVLYFEKTGGTQFNLIPNFPTGWKMIIDNIDSTLNGQPVKQNPLNVMPIGSIFQSYMEFKNAPTPTDQQLIDLAEFTDKWCTQLKITSRTFDKDLNNTTVIFNEVEDYVGAVSQIKSGNVISGYPTDGLIQQQLEYITTEDGGDPPSRTPLVELDIRSGMLYTTNIIDGGIGNRQGMTYRLPDYPGLTKYYVEGIDQQAGWSFSANRSLSLTNSNLTITSGGIPYEVDWFIIPTQQHDSTSLGQRLVYRKLTETPSIQSNFPVSLQESQLDVTRTPNDFVSDRNCSNGMFRGSGDLDSSIPEFNTYRGAFVNHDSTSSFRVINSTGTLVNHLVGVGSSPADVVVPYTGTQYWLLTSGVLLLRLNKTNFDALNQPLPLNRTITFFDAGATFETHIQTLGLSSVDATYYYINVLAQASHKQRTTSISATLSSATTLNVPDKRFPGRLEDFTENLPPSITQLFMTYVSDPKTFNTQAQLNWTSDINGSIGITSQNNFFGSNDIMYDDIIKNREPIALNADDLTIRSYNSGGYYYLSKYHGIMTTKDGTSYNYNLDNGNYNLGYDNFLLGQLPDHMYTWRSGYRTPSDINYNQNFTDIHENWDYYPFYRQKTITIDKNFCVATDISGIWNNKAHEIGDAINPIDGSIYTTKENSGILQNEFIMPVYGSNNLIDDNGNYIKDYTLYADSDGLEPGHAKGIALLQSNNNWLSGNIMYHLPKDENGISYYDVLFRTPFTKIRNYDPLATVPSTSNPSYVAPDRTPLTTVNLTADKIGNANTPGSTTKKALNGDTMIEQTAIPPPTPNTNPSAYELGTAGGVPVGGTPVKFGNQSFYPIYYLDETKRAEYQKAKISNFVGSSEVALVFDTSISAFTFQYLHQPFTSQFIDGQGGDQSVRVFFGNRREGIVNHDAVGGLVVVNYARPDYPRNTFSRIEVEDNLATGEYFPSGINPLQSTSRIGRNFMNKLGFKDGDIGVLSNGKIDPNNTQLNYKITTSTRDLTGLEDADPVPSDFTIKVADTIFYGTTGTDIDTTDSIISQIPSAESSAGLESNNQLLTPFVGRSRQVYRKWGDFIFYPYGINSDSNSFSDTTSIVRYDNATSTFGTVGGMLLSNSARSMGIPNVLGSLSNVDDSTIPVQLNPDCLIYTSYTIACGSSTKQASSLPIKLNQGYLLVLSSLIKQPNVYLSKVGFVNAMSVINTTFLTGDYILSQGELQFYAPQDTYISQITTTIRNNNFTAPSTLGKNSTVIYSITDYNPTSDKEPLTIDQEQDNDMELMSLMEEHGSSKEQGKLSRLDELNQDFYQLGLDVMTRQSGDVISAVQNQIRVHDLPNLTRRERAQFLQTPTGQILLDNATDIQMLRSHLDDYEEAQSNPLQDVLTQQRLARSQRESQGRIDNIRERTPEVYFQREEPQLAEPVKGKDEDEDDEGTLPQSVWLDAMARETRRGIPEEDRGIAYLGALSTLTSEDRMNAMRNAGRLREPEFTDEEDDDEDE